MITKVLSEKIKIASFICTVMVVFRHSLNHIAFWGQWNPSTISGFIEGGNSTLTEVAVPLFFTISGFFFFNKTYYPLQFYLKMVTKKIKSLITPFLIWNFVGALILIATHKFIYENSLFDYFTALVRSDWYGPLWYIRTLVIFMLAYPIYGWIACYSSSRLYFACLLIAFYFWEPVDCNWISTEGILFFLAGGYLSQKHSLTKLHISGYMTTAFFFIWMILCFIHPFWGKAIWKFNTIFGIFTLWQMIDFIPSNWKIKLLSIAPYSFFIFVNHFYLLKSMKVSLAVIFPQNEIVALLAYFLLPLITIIILFYIGKHWYKFHPTSYLFITGGRG